MAKRERFFVYMLGSTGKGGIKTYVGWTLDCARRLAQHNAGTGAKSTRGRAWVLLYTEACRSRTDAMSREWHLKRDRALRKRLAAAFEGEASSPAVRAPRRPQPPSAVRPRRSGPA